MNKLWPVCTMLLFTFNDSAFAQSCPGLVAGELFEGLYRGGWTTEEPIDPGSGVSILNPGVEFSVAFLVRPEGQTTNIGLNQNRNTGFFIGATRYEMVVSRPIGCPEEFSGGVSTVNFFDLTFTYTGTLTENTLSLRFSGSIPELENFTLIYNGTCEGICGFTSEMEGEGEGEEADVIRWNTAAGAFDDVSSWTPEQVPTAAEIALFDNPGESVAMIDNAQSLRAEFRRGITLLSGGTYSLAEDSLQDRSFVVSNDPGEATHVTLINNVLDTVHSSVGLDTGMGAQVNVGPLSSWFNSGRISVGHGGDGTVVLLDGAELMSAESRIGDEPGGTTGGFVAVGESPSNSSGAMATWDTGNLAVGFNGEGELIINSGIVMSDEAVTIGDQPGSVGTVTMDGPESSSQWEVAGDVLVGPEGTGTLIVRNGNDLFIPDDLTVGDESSGNGLVTIENATILVTNDLRVGEIGTGTIEMVDGGILTTTGPADIGANGTGTVIIRDAPCIWTAGVITLGAGSGEGRLIMSGEALVLADTVVVTAESSISGSGTIAATVFLSNGTIDPGISGTPENPVEEDEGEGEKQDDGNGRILEIESDNPVEFDGGTLDTQIDGTAGGEFDQLLITGDATLTDITIMMRFADGFAPAMGDEFPVVMATGSLMTENVVVETEGLDPAFAFEVMNVNGMLMVMTTAVPSVQEGVGEGASEGPGCAAGTAGRLGNTPTTVDLLLLALTMFALFVCRPMKKDLSLRSESKGRA